MAAVGANSHTLRVFHSNSLLSRGGGGGGEGSLKEIYCHPDYHCGSIYCLDWCGNTLLASGSNDQSIKLLNYTDDTFTLVGDIGNCGATIRELSFLPNTTSTLLTCGSNGLQLVDLENLKVSRDFKTFERPLLSLSPIDENTFLTGSEDGYIIYWDRRCTQSPSQLYTSPSNPITSLSVHKDIISCAIGSGGCVTLSLSSKDIINQWSPHTGECRSIRYSPNGQWILSSSYDGSVCITSGRSYKWECFTQLTNKVIQSRWHPSGDLVACTSADKTASFWTVQ